MSKQIKQIIKQLYPVNNEEKIDHLIYLLKTLKISKKQIKEIEIEVIMQIKKMKTQLYFKKMIVNLHSGDATGDSIIAKTETEHNSISKITIDTKLQLAFEQLKDKSIKEIGEFLEFNLDYLKRIINQSSNNDIEVFDEMIITNEIWQNSNEFLNNLYKLKTRKEKLKSNNGIRKMDKPFSKMPNKYGRPGNYFKLILSSPKY